MVRPTVTWAITAIFGYGLLKGFIPWEAASPIIAMVMVFWFEEKAIERTIEKMLTREREGEELIKRFEPFMTRVMDFLVQEQKREKPET